MKPFDEMSKKELKDETQNEILASINNSIVWMEGNVTYSEQERKVFIEEMKNQGNRVAKFLGFQKYFH